MTCRVKEGSFMVSSVIAGQQMRERERERETFRFRKPFLSFFFLVSMLPHHQLVFNFCFQLFVTLPFTNNYGD